MKKSLNLNQTRHKPRFDGKIKSRLPSSVFRLPSSVFRLPSSLESSYRSFLSFFPVFSLIVVLSLALAGCFSPYSGEKETPAETGGIILRFVGDSTISQETFFGDAYQVNPVVEPSGEGAGPSLHLYNPSTVAGQLTGYEVVLSLGSYTKTFTAGPGGVISGKVPPGNYTITVRGMAAPATGGYTTFGTAPMLWARGEVKHTITGGASPVTVDMYPAAEVSNGAQLNEILTIPGPGPVRHETVFITGTVDKPSSAPFNIQRPITLKGSEEKEIRTNGASGSLFTVISPGILTINGPTLTGHGNNSPLVQVQSGGKLVLESGTIKGNTNTASSGGGVYVDTGCTFEMKEGTITNNHTSQS
ncbi:MAG: hypothetical protein LBD31_00660, partial [Treponema sp.]|nr:hypothetical protein [Treponema sp.]